METQKIKNWREFIQLHKDRAEYNSNAEQIQQIINPKDNPTSGFSHLVDYQSLIVLTRSFSGKEVQTTFFHSNLKASLLPNEHEHIALSGFGKRACAMRIDAKEMFRLTQMKKVTSFEAIMKCLEVEGILNLVPSDEMIGEKLESHAVL